MADISIDLIICCIGDARQNAQLLNAAHIAAVQDGSCNIVDIRTDGDKTAYRKKINYDSAVFILAPGAIPDNKAIATARNLVTDGQYAVVLGSARFPQTDPMPRLAELEQDFRHRQIAQKENLPSDPACAVFSPDAFRVVSGSGALCGIDSIHELACNLLAMDYEVGFNPSLKALREPPHTWKDFAGLFFAQGTQLARRLAGVGGMGLEKRPWQPSAAGDAILVLATLGFAGFGLYHDLTANLTRALICVLLLYPVSRGFLGYVSESAPELMHKALFLCLIRALCRTAGLIITAFSRLVGS